MAVCNIHTLVLHHQFLTYKVDRSHNPPTKTNKKKINEQFHPKAHQTATGHFKIQWQNIDINWQREALHIYHDLCQLRIRGIFFYMQYSRVIEFHLIF